MASKFDLNLSLTGEDYSALSRNKSMGAPIPRFEYDFDKKRIEGDNINSLTLPIVENFAFEKAASLKALLVDKMMNIVTAESLTAGQITKTLSDVPGNGAALYGGFCTYDTDAKRKFINVKTRGVYCEETAKQMAEGALLKSRAMVGLSVTGNSMPYYDHKEHIGEVFFGVSIRRKGGNKKSSRKSRSSRSSRSSRKSRSSETPSNPHLYTKTIMFDTKKVLGMEALCKLWSDSQGNDPKNKKFAPPQLTYFLNTIIRTATVAYSLSFCEHVINRFCKEKQKTSKITKEAWDVGEKGQKPSWIIYENLSDKDDVPTDERKSALEFSPHCEETIFEPFGM